MICGITCGCWRTFIRRCVDRYFPLYLHSYRIMGSRFYERCLSIPLFILIHLSISTRSPVHLPFLFSSRVPPLSWLPSTPPCRISCHFPRRQINARRSDSRTVTPSLSSQFWNSSSDLRVCKYLKIIHRRSRCSREVRAAHGI